MADPTKSWALVVGIDQYSDAIVPPLDGAAADALAAVEWLRGIGLPDDQILLHTVASAATAPAIAALNLPKATAVATFDSIDASLVTLSENSGDRLYVFLAGHAVYEPSEGRLFLCQDFANRGALVSKTLGIDALIRCLLSYPFREQFLFMDGCQNFSYSPAVRRKFRTTLDGASVTPDEANNGLVTVFGASMGELAQERNGRGAFLGTLLPVLDPMLLASMPPQQGLGRAITLDFQTGESLIDLEQLVGWAREAMQAEGIAQTPSCGKHGRAAAGAMPLLRLPALSTSEVTVELTPPGVSTDISEITVTCDDVQARRRQPAVGVAAVSFPDQFRVPVGTVATIVCRGNPGTKVVPAWERVDASGPRVTVRFAVEPLPAAMPAAPQRASLRVNLRQPDGSPSYEMSPQLYHDLQSRLGPHPADNVNLNHHETGPEFEVAGDTEEDHARAAEIASNWRHELGVVFASRNITAAASGGVQRGAGIRLRLPSGTTAESLAGPARNASNVSIRTAGGPAESEVVREVPVGSANGQEVQLPPGPAVVSLNLPWGSWSQVVNVPPSGLTEVELPATIGAPPLRVGLSDESRSGQRRILGAGVWAGGPPAGTTMDPGGRRRAKLRPNPAPGNAAWALSAPGAATMVRLDTPVPIRFPLFGNRNFAVSIASGQPRVEPLSDIESFEWDLLVGSGRLDALDPEQAVRLTNDKWFDELLGLAGAYAIYGNLPRDPARFAGYLRIVLSNLRNRVAHESADLQLLEAYLRVDGVGGGGAEPAALPELEPLAKSRAVPLFRWGVSLALDLLGRPSKLTAAARAWEKQLTSLDEGISLASAWTVVSGEVPDP